MSPASSVPAAASAAASAARAASTSASGSSAVRAVVRPAIGARVDTSKRYTDTGGSGLDSTEPSRSPEHRATRIRALYRAALRDIPHMRINFTIVEDEGFVARLIRDQFDQQGHVIDGKLADMLIFRGIQELGEISNQFKSRNQIAAYIDEYHEKLHREALMLEATGSGATIAESSASAEKNAMLATWKQRGLVPADILTWGQYERWKAEENEAFASFAVDAQLFSEESLKRNEKAKSQCSVM